jgi:pyruvate formate lyase activating enzyme
MLVAPPIRGIGAESPPINLGADPSEVDEESIFRREASYYEKLPELKVECRLCPRRCSVDDAERGYCGVRENWEGTYYTLVYGRACTYHLDPVEKKPLFHFLPGSAAFSVSTAGCNVECKFCQNWQLSQSRPEALPSYPLPPKVLLAEADRAGAQVVAFTYAEPVVCAEYMRDTAAAGKGGRLRTVMISNGYIEAEPMEELAAVLDGVKIDLKAFRDSFYRELVNGKLQPVLDTLVLLARKGVWFEIVYLMVTGKNDEPQEIREMSRWIASELGPEVPVHFTRFHPTYKLKNLPPTPLPVLERAREIALEEGLSFVYLGNVPGHAGESTYCPGCRSVLIRRVGYRTKIEGLRQGKCDACGRTIPGVWS